MSQKLIVGLQANIPHTMSVDDWLANVADAMRRYVAGNMLIGTNVYIAPGSIKAMRLPTSQASVDAKAAKRRPYRPRLRRVFVKRYRTGGRKK